MFCRNDVLYVKFLKKKEKKKKIDYIRSRSLQSKKKKKHFKSTRNLLPRI